MPNYYFDEVVKGNWNFGDKIVIDTTNERAYYRDSISVNEKIILLTDPAFGSWRTTSDLSTSDISTVSKTCQAFRACQLRKDNLGECKLTKQIHGNLTI